MLIEAYKLALYQLQTQATATNQVTLKRCSDIQIITKPAFFKRGWLLAQSTDTIFGSHMKYFSFESLVLLEVK